MSENQDIIAPMPPPPLDDQAPQPGVLTAAVVLWKIEGVVLTFAYGFSAIADYGHVSETRPIAGLVLAVAAVAIWRLANGMRHGRDNRVALAVLGFVPGLALLPLTLAAVVLQWLPPSRRWFALPPAEKP